MTTSYLPLGLCLVLLFSCVRKTVSARDNDGCIPITELKLSKKKLAVIIPALRARVDTRRVKFTLNRFCGYEKPTSNGKFQILTVYQNGANHVSENWILLSDKQAVDTKLNSYLMVTDSVGMQQLIVSSVNQLTDADEPSRQELIQMLTKESRTFRKRGLILGSQKPPMK